MNQVPPIQPVGEALAMNPDNGEHETRGEPPTRELTASRAPTRELPAVPAAGSGDQCSNCGAPMAHDQHYCVECGERRGQSSMPQAQPTTEVRSTRVRAAGASRPPRMSSGATLISGVGVLLLAIGLGVLIGRIGNNSGSPKTNGAATQVISVNGGGAGNATAGTTSTPTTASHVSKKTQSKLNAAAKASAPPPAAVQKKATQAAGKVLGNANNLAPPTVTNGQKCSSSQAGCSGGKFNGNFFGQ